MGSQTQSIFQNSAGLIEYIKSVYNVVETGTCREKFDKERLLDFVRIEGKEETFYAVIQTQPVRITNHGVAEFQKLFRPTQPLSADVLVEAGFTNFPKPK